jgi:uncharacterized protein YbjT (DUF2867 family)
MRILVTGATGFIGGNLVKALRKKHSVRALVRREAAIPGVEVVIADLNDKKALVKALKGIEVAYYLVHSMSQTSKFEEMELASAKNFAKACDANNVKRIIYLSGIIPSGELSPHLRSRKRVGDELMKSSAKVTEFRASIIVGAKGSSFQIIQELVEKMPFIIWPFKNTLNQPIALEDAQYYLVKSLEEKKTVDKTYDIGGPDIISFKDMLTIYAEEKGLRRRIIETKLYNAWLYSFLISLITQQPRKLIKALIESLKHDVVCKENKIRKILPRRLMTYREAVRRAIN